MLPGMYLAESVPPRAIPSEVDARVRSADVAEVRRLLLASDLSSASQAATAAAFDLALRHEAHLVVLSVVDPRLLRLPGGRFVRRVDQERDRVQVGVRDIVERARHYGIRATFLVWEGDPADVILEAAEAEDVDLIVMGSHGRGRIGRLLLGSTSAHVSAEARRQVLVVQS